VIDADATVVALTENPERTVLLVDFDGSLAPIVERPADARPWPAAPAVLARLAARFGRVGVVSGRPVSFLARELPVDGLVLVGLYGMEQSIDGAYAVDPRVQPYLVAVAAAIAELEQRLPPEIVEPKSGVSVTLHWRPAPDRADEVCAIAHEIALRHGLTELNTRMAVELRPPIEVDKAVAVRGLIEGFEVASFAGDDYGDLPAFAELGRAVGDGRLRATVRIGVHSPEAPRELEAAVDVLVDGPPALVELLARVADEAG
jgi:trehalose 6-phosphate phosphatase